MAHLDHTPELPEQPDEWHMHTAAEGPPQEEHGGTVNTALLMLAFVGTVASIALVVVLTYLYYASYSTQVRASRIETTVLSEDYRQYRAKVHEAMTGFNWVEMDGEPAVSLPLDVATERVLQRYSGQSGTGGSGR